MPLGPEIIAATSCGCFPQKAHAMSSRPANSSCLSFVIAGYSLFFSSVSAAAARDVVMRSTRP